MAESASEHIARVGTRVGRTVAREELTIPYYVEEGIVLRGMAQEVLSLADDGETIGEVTAGAGLGGDFVQMKWKDDTVTFFLRDVLRAWVEKVDPEAAKKLPRANLELDPPEEAT